MKLFGIDVKKLVVAGLLISGGFIASLFKSRDLYSDCQAGDLESCVKYMSPHGFGSTTESIMSELKSWPAEVIPAILPDAQEEATIKRNREIAMREAYEKNLAFAKKLSSYRKTGCVEGVCDSDTNSPNTRTNSMR